MGQCPECGTRTSAEHAFCLSCGAELEDGTKGRPEGDPSTPRRPPDDIVPPPPAGADVDPVAGDAASGSDAGSTVVAGDPSEGSSAPAEAEEGSQSGPAERTEGTTPVRAGAEGLPPEGAAARTPARPTPGSRGGRGRGSRRPDRSSWIPAALAVVLSIAFQQGITMAVPADAYVYRLFRPAGGWVMGVVPALIQFALTWTLIDLFLKSRISRKNERDLSRSDVNQIPNLVAQEPAGTTLRRLRAWDGGMQSRPVGRRVLWLLQHMETNDAQRAHDLMRHQSDIDADEAASGYRTVKLFIWAMPILGFIGTVLGISLAVGGFSEFLTTSVSIDQVDAVTAELGEVASGLSFAFDTTLLGLLGGLIASVVSSGVQAREERLLTRLDELGLRIMETADPALGQSQARRPAHAASAAGDDFDRMMQGRLGELSTQMDHFTSSVQSGLDGFLGEWSKLPPEVHNVAQDLEGLREHLTSAARSTDQVVLETRMLLEGLHEASSDLETRVSTSIGSLGATADGLGSALSEASEQVARGLDGLNDRLASSDRHLRSALEGLHAAMERSHRDAEAVAASDAAAERAFRNLSTSIDDLGAKLAQFGEVQAQLGPVLRQLSQPMELRLMPASPPAQAPSGAERTPPPPPGNGPRER